MPDARTDRSGRPLAEADIVPPLRACSLPAERERPIRFVQRREVRFCIDGAACENLAYAWRVDSRHGPAGLAHAIAALTGRHETLRLRFATRCGYPVAIDDPANAAPLEVVCLQHLPRVALQRSVARLVAEEVQEPIVLTKAPLIRLRLVLGGQAEDLLIMIVPHILWDVRSSGVFGQQLASLLAPARAGAAVQPLGLGDYAEYERRARNPRALAYWRDRLAGYSKELRVGSARHQNERPHQTLVRRFRAAAQTTALRLRDVARQQGTTPRIVMLASFAAYLARTTQQSDITVAAADSNRARPELQDVLGYLVTMNLLRLDITPQQRLLTVIAETHKANLEAMMNELPAEWQAGDPLRLEAEACPLCDAVFNFVPESPSPGHSARVAGKPRPVPALPASRLRCRTATFPIKSFPWGAAIDFEIFEHPGGSLSGALRYDVRQFSTRTTTSLARGYAHTLVLVGQNPTITVGALPDGMPHEH